MSTTSSPFPARAAGNRLKHIRLLIIDNSEHTTQLVRDIFRDLGFQHIFTAHNAVEGVKILKAQHIHMIFADGTLRLADNLAENTSDKIDSTRFVQRLRRAAASPNPFVPVMLMLDGSDPTTAEQARDAGVNAVIKKPLSMRELCVKLIDLIEHPRIFVTSPLYFGPCRRLAELPCPTERRTMKFHVLIPPTPHGSHA